MRFGYQFGKRVMTLFRERWSLIDMILNFQLFIFSIGEVAVIWGFATSKAVGQVLYLYWIVIIPLLSLLAIRALLAGHRKKRKKS